jgi:2-haloacid dehalogenase
MLDAVIGASGMRDYFSYVLSADSVKKYKTAPECYQMGPDAFGLPVGKILFVSSNCWDVCGATWFGYVDLIP